MKKEIFFTSKNQKPKFINTINVLLLICVICILGMGYIVFHNLKSNIIGYTNSGIAILKTDLEWRNNLFHNNETWNDKVIQPERCKAGKTNKLNDIAMISKNILNEHPDK